MTSQFEATKFVDAVTPSLLELLTVGATFNATIQVYMPGTTTVAATYKLSHAVISQEKRDLGKTKPTETIVIVATDKKGV